ncbi:MAG TPA: hypothetical protein VK619_17480 [Pyrinomonadaceae bacterium]|nr:hypothetical protein [Pyrinomonadaceae bacterium]
MPGDRNAERLRWAELSAIERAALRGKLRELYGRERSDEEVFDQIDVDKQRALLIFARRLKELGLWDDIESVLNVYGEGGVGFSFVASSRLLEVLLGRKDFTRRFARHRSHSAGFIERNRRRGSLHFLYATDKTPQWSAHFDLYSPASARHAFRHLLSEKLRRKTPGWREIKAVLWDDE